MKKILIIAGEASGDIHGANLVRSIRTKTKNVKFYGLGGQKMEEAGVKLYYNLATVAVLGLFEVLKKCSFFKKIFSDTVKKLDEEKFDCVILIDYPGFNLRFAKQVKRRNIPLLYYISPQVWAWGKGRIKLIKKVVNKMVVFFKFEEEFYKKAGMDVAFVGHPLLDIVKPDLSREEAYKYFSLTSNKKTIAILPGSRQFEVKLLLPIVKKAAELIKKEYPDTQFLVAKLPSLKMDIFDEVLKDNKAGIRVVENKTYDVISVADAVIVKSGTSTLETAILQKPMVIIYKVSFLTYFITKIIIRLPYLGLVNVIAGKMVVPEFLQYDARPDLIAKEVLNLLKDPKAADEMRRSLNAVKTNLGESGANERAAAAVLDFISKN